MATRNISLTPEQDAFVKSVVKSGEYRNASEAVRDALRMLQLRRREDALKLKALRVQIKAGVDALERGDFVEVDDSDLDDYLEGLTGASSGRLLHLKPRRGGPTLAQGNALGNAVQIHQALKGRSNPNPQLRDKLN
jgi:antitoxin ParD1/3/4